ncbi:MAG: ABC transporter substrate-binding protein [Lachnospirales bacterium]|nr:glycerol-3-phosphate transporter periplasmic binding protein [uncultured Clostridium sp.]
MKKRNVTVLSAMICAGLTAGLFMGVDVKADGVKLVFAQDLDTGEKANNVMNEILNEYTEKTGTEIQFESLPSADYRTWIMTQFAADQGPDVYTGIIYDMSSDYQSGYLSNFKDLYDQESTYDTGKAWKDTLPDYIRERMYITADDVPGYPTATSVVRIFYNKTMLEQVGAEVPETWAEFMDVCQKLKDADIIPFAFPNATIDDLSWLWFNNSVCSQMDAGIVDQLDVSGNGYVELAEICKGMDEGIIDFTDESLKASFELMKDFSQYWTSDYNGLDQATAVDMFARGEVAMVQAMSTKLESIETTVGDSFEYGVMPVPVITDETYEGALGKSVILGGQPDIIFGINKSLEEDEEKYNAALDFVQYMSSPEIQVRLAEELCRIPLANTVELPEKLSGFKITEEPLRMAWFTGINEKLRNYFHRAGQEYLADSITVDEFAETMNNSYKEVLDEIKAENSWSADNNYGM